MANGVIAGGRSISTISGGRGIVPIAGSPWSGWSGLAPNGFYSPGSPAAWPRSAAMCAPAVQCCCKGPWNIGPGEIQPLVIDFSLWIASVPGYTLIGVASGSLSDMTRSPPAAADPNVIKVITGIAGRDPDPPDNSDVGDLISLLPGGPPGVQCLIEASPNAQIGAQYKLDLCLTACDGCDGRKIRLCDCVVITIAEC